MREVGCCEAAALRRFNELGASSILMRGKDLRGRAVAEGRKGCLARISYATVGSSGLDTLFGWIAIGLGSHVSQFRDGDASDVAVGRPLGVRQAKGGKHADGV